jgi:hypothetical protein
LFIDGDYKNINWYGMWVLVSFMLFVSLLSYVIPFGKWNKVARQVGGFFRNIWDFLKKALKPLSEFGNEIKTQIGYISHACFSLRRRQRRSWPSDIVLPAISSPSVEEPDDPL